MVTEKKGDGSSCILCPALLSTLSITFVPVLPPLSLILCGFCEDCFWQEGVLTVSGVFYPQENKG